MRILVVDDVGINRLLLSSTLERWGHSVVAVADGTEAWELLQQEQFSFVISDWLMPKMSGVELCRRIRAAQLPWYVYVILLTSLGRPHEIVEGLDAGADDFVQKPFHEDELRARMRAGERIVALERSLLESNQQLRQAYTTLREDLQAASQVQQSLLPSPSTTVPGLQFAWFFCPHTFVAGDSFNFYRLDETHVGFYSIDVAGHGAAAAMQSVTLSRFLSPLLEHDSVLKYFVPNPPHYVIRRPEAVVRRLNDCFQSNTDTMRYFTMVYGVIDLANNRVRLTQAGHPSPLHQRGRTVTAIGVGGFPVGMLPGMDYEYEEFDFQPGDRLVLYSDGITECLNPEGAEFSPERLVALLRDQDTLSLQDTAKYIEHHLRLWRESDVFDDDVTLFAIERV